MAGDRHGKHNTTTISFRVNSYEKATIEERVKVSGMKKQDYIVRSCIYNQVCVVGKKETIEIIRSEMKEMSLVLEDVAKDLKSEKPVISEPVLDSMTERYLAFLEAALWMLKGSSYLWEDKKDGRESNEILCQSYGTGRVEELVELMLDAICSTKTYQQINGEAVPTQVVKSRLLKVGYEHIQYVFFSLDRSTSKVKNIRQYMLTVLYNAPATINQFYDAEVRHDMYIPDR